MLSFKQWLNEEEKIPFSSNRIEQQTRNWLKKKIKGADQPYIHDTEMRNSLSSYSGSTYKSINSFLRGNALSDIYELSSEDEIKKHVKNIERAIQNSRLPKDMWLHHGAKDEIDNNGKKARGFMSTSLHPYATTEFARYPYNPKYEYFMKKDKSELKRAKIGTAEHDKILYDPDYQYVNPKHVIHFHAPKGSRGLYLTKELSHNYHENEVLLHHGAQVKFHKIPRASFNAFSGPYIHWYGKLVHDGIEPTRHAKQSELKMHESVLEKLRRNRYRPFLIETSEDHKISTLNISKRRPWLTLKQQRVNPINAASKELDDDELDSLEQYTSSNYKDINNYLRKKLEAKERGGDHNDHYIGPIVSHISRAIQKSKLTKDVWLHHGTKAPPVNNEKIARGFMSTTINPSKTTFFSNAEVENKAYFIHKNENRIKECDRLDNETYEKLRNDPDWTETYVNNILHIHTPKGARALYLAKISSHEHEDEVLLHHGARIKIHSNSSFARQSSSPYSNMYRHWYGKLVHDGIEPTCHSKKGTKLHENRLLAEITGTYDMKKYKSLANRPWTDIKRDKVDVGHNHIDSSERHHLRTYAGSHYERINNYLRKKLEGANTKDDNAETEISEVSRAIRKSKLPKDVWLHHGMKGYPTSQEKVARGFMSTTIDPMIASTFTDGKMDDKKQYYVHKKEKKVKIVDSNSKEAFQLDNDPDWHNTFTGHHIMHIHAPKGSRALYLGDLALHAEDEVLLHHGARVKIHGKPRMDYDPDRHIDLQVHWYGKLVHDGIEPTRHAKKGTKLHENSDEEHSLSGININKIRPWLSLKKRKLDATKSADNLDPMERKNVTDYTGSYYSDINSYLRHRKDYMDNPELMSTIENIRNAIRKSKLPKDVWLHHGMKAAPVNNEKIARGFMSTTINPTRVSAFTMAHYDTDSVYFLNPKENKIKKVEMYSPEWDRLRNDKNWETAHLHHAVHLHAPSQARALYVRDISNHPDEDEVLLHHGAHVIIHSKPRFAKSKYGSIFAHWFGKLVHDGIEPTRHAKKGK